MNSTLSRAGLTSRHHISGRLVMQTALHIGGGREIEAITDSPVVRLPSGDPYIPGSSLKGAFRAAVERIAPHLGYRSCGLIEEDPACPCLSMHKKLKEAYQVLQGAVGRALRDGEGIKKALQDLSLPESEWLNQVITEHHLLTVLEKWLCDTCKTFGSVHLASVVAFHDLSVIGEWHDVFQIRDGVGIDRDSERAKDRIKFDFEVVPPGTAFELSLALENPSRRDLALVALGLQEFVDGMVPIGGIRSRGLGRCRLEALKVAWVDLTNSAALREYLVTRRMTEEDGAAFIASHLQPQLTPQEG